MCTYHRPSFSVLCPKTYPKVFQVETFHPRKIVNIMKHHESDNPDLGTREKCRKPGRYSELHAWHHRILEIVLKVH